MSSLSLSLVLAKYEHKINNNNYIRRKKCRLSLSLSLSLVLCGSVLFRARVLFWRRRWWFFSLSRIYLFSSSFSKKKISSRNLFWHLWVKSTNNGFFLARWDFLFFFCKTRTKKRGIWRRRRRRRESSLSLCRVFLTGVFLRVGSCCILSKKKTRKSRENTGKKQQH